MAVATAAPYTSATIAEPRIRKIGVHDLGPCLSQGWDDFRATPTQLVFLCVVYPIVGLIAARAAYGGPTLPLLFPLVSGFALVGPIAALGIYELSRRREMGEDVSWLRAFDVLRSPSIGAIGVVAVLLLAIFAAWMASAALIYRITFGTVAPASIGAFVHDLFSTSDGTDLIMLGNVVGLGFAGLVLSLTVVSLPLLLDRDVGPVVAIRTSLRVVRANPVPMAAWGLIVAVLLLAGTALLMVGLAVVLPVLGHATWHLYRRVVTW